MGFRELRSSKEGSRELRFRPYIDSTASLVLKPQEFGAEPIELGLRGLRRGTDRLGLFLKGIHTSGCSYLLLWLAYILGGKQTIQVGHILPSPLITL